MRCWATSDGNSDAFFRRYTVSCHLTSAALTGLSRSSVAVQTESAKGATLSSILTSTPDTDVVVGAVTADSLPLSVHLYGVWASADEATDTSFQSPALQLGTVTDSGHPLIVRSPFSTWHLTFLDHSSFAAVQTSGYAIDTAPFFTETSINPTKHSLETSASTGIISTPSASLDVIAPASGGLALSVNTEGGAYSVTATGPATYVLEDSGVRLATAADGDGGAPVASADAGTTTEAGGGSDSGSDAASASDAGTAVDAATTCGGPSQAFCTTNGTASCNAGTRFDESSSTCVACGAAGETYCVSDPQNLNGNAFCDSATRFDQSTSTCLPCGAAGQTYCVDDAANVNGNAVCDNGTRFDQSSSTCIACGASGQTYCVNDPHNVSGNAVCNAGLTFDPSSSTCQ